MSTHKKTHKTSPKTKLNIYAKNFKHINDDKNRKHVSKLTNFLADNEWLKLSKEKYYDFKIDKKIFNDKDVISSISGTHPGYVSWFSKGSWLFHDHGRKIDQEIIYITVDYKNIYKITNKSPYSDLSSNDDYKSQLSKFNKKYIIKDKRTQTRLVDKEDSSANCNFIKSEEKDDCIKEYSAQNYNWAKFLKDYDGLAIYPMMTLKEMETIQNHYGFLGWDIETLVLSNDAPIITHHNLGTIRELLNITKKTDKNTKVDINYSKLVSKLIQKINEVRKL
jgi:hypothetical protein